MSLFKKTSILWFAFVPVAILNGIVREAWYQPRVGELAGHQISTVIAAIAFFLLASYLLRDAAAKASVGTLLAAGLLLSLMTAAFDFGFGYYVDGRTLSWLLQDYNILRGNLWGVFLLFELFTPLLVHISHKQTVYRTVQ